MDFNIVRKAYADTFRYARQSDPRMVDSYISYLREGMESPSVAKLIAIDEENKMSDYYRRLAKEEADIAGSTNPIVKNCKQNFIAHGHMQTLDYDLKVLWHRNMFDLAFHQMYPKTAKIREKLIIGQQVVFDKVKPKMSLLKKMLIRF